MLQNVNTNLEHFLDLRHGHDHLHLVHRRNHRRNHRAPHHDLRRDLRVE